MRVRLIEEHWIPRWLGVEAIVLYPWMLFARARREWSPALVTHEMIHLRQVRASGIACFYLRYLGEYLAGRARGRSHDQAYRAISYEKEAYAGGGMWEESCEEYRKLAKELGLEALYEERLAAHADFHGGKPS